MDAGAVIKNDVTKSDVSKNDDVKDKDNPHSFDALIALAEKWTRGRGIDVVLDLAGGPYVKASQKLMAVKGRMILVGSVAGATYELESRYVMSRAPDSAGHGPARPVSGRKIQVTQAFAAEVVPLFAKGILHPDIDSTFKMEEIAKAHERLESIRRQEKW